MWSIVQCSHSNANNRFIISEKMWFIIKRSEKRKNDPNY